MTDQYTPPNSDAPVIQANPASVYNDLDQLTLTQEELALSAAITQTQVDMAEDSAQTLADMQSVMAEEDAARSKN